MFGPSAASLCARIGVEHPLLLAPMAGGFATPELVAAVSNSGGLGSFAATLLGPDQIEAEINSIRSLTDGPIGANFLVAPPITPESDQAKAMHRVLSDVRRRLELPQTDGIPTLPPTVVQEQLRAVAEARVPVVSFSMGLPSPETVAMFKDAGAFVIVGVTTVSEARQAEAVGADALVAQGYEAGGHRFSFEIPADEPLPMIGTLALVPQVVDAVSIPVVAAGGIMDGRGIAAVLALGASAAQMGTRFLLAKECGLAPAYRDMLVSATEESTAVTTALSGRPARGIRNRIVDSVEKSGVDSLPWPYQAVAASDIYREMAARGDAEWFPVWAGQGLRTAKVVQPAADIITEVLREANEVLGGLNA